MNLDIDPEKHTVDDSFTEVTYGHKKCRVCSAYSPYKYCKKCYSTFTTCENKYCISKCKSKFCSEECYYTSNKRYKNRTKICINKGCTNESEYKLCTLCYKKTKN